MTNPTYVFITRHSSTVDPVDVPYTYRLRRAADNGVEAGGFKSLAEVHEFITDSEFNYVLIEDHDAKLERVTTVTYDVWCSKCPFEFSDTDKAVAEAKMVEHIEINHREAES